MSVRFKVCLVAWIAVVAVAACTNSVSGQDLAPLPLPDSLNGSSPALIPVPQQHTEIAPQPLTNEVPNGFGHEFVPGHASEFSDDNWVMHIRPAAKVPLISPVTLNGAPVDAGAYARIFASIPFNRAAYDANPNYQHDSTMEILTGNARHQTIVRHTTTRGVRPTQVVPAGFGNPYLPSQYGYLRPALRLNYYRNFQSLNPYLNRGNLSGAF